MREPLDPPASDSDDADLDPLLALLARARDLAAGLLTKARNHLVWDAAARKITASDARRRAHGAGRPERARRRAAHGRLHNRAAASRGAGAAPGRGPARAALSHADEARHLDSPGAAWPGALPCADAAGRGRARVAPPASRTVAWTAAAEPAWIQHRAPEQPTTVHSRFAPFTPESGRPTSPHGDAQRCRCDQLQHAHDVAEASVESRRVVLRRTACQDGHASGRARRLRQDAAGAVAGA